jgi:hypothetical protein
MPKRRFDSSEFWNDHWRSLKEEIKEEIQEMIVDAASTETEREFFNIPIRFKAAFIRRATLAKRWTRRHPEFHHLATVGTADVIRVAAAVGVEKLKTETERMRDEKQKTRRDHQDFDRR